MADELGLAFLRARPDTIERLVEHQRIRETPLPGGDTCVAQRLTLDDGTDLFTKTRRADSLERPGFFEAEAAGLRWLAETGTVPVPEVVAALPGRLVLTWVEPGPATQAGFEQLGRDLAALHASPVTSPVTGFGAPWAGYIGSLPMDNTPTTTWAELYAERRVRPYLRQAVDAGRVEPADAQAVDRVLDRLDELAGPPEPPARLHGDLWHGNVLPARDGRVYVVDPAAHGGHGETDLAMLALFGAPHLDALLAAYQEVRPLADGWLERRGLHQLHPLLVHAVLFGGSYGARAGTIARRYA